MAVDQDPERLADPARSAPGARRDALAELRSPCTSFVRPWLRKKASRTRWSGAALRERDHLRVAVTVQGEERAGPRP
jgi:hypothetical protein